MRFHRMPHHFDEARPLIYMWEICDARGDLVGRYVGKALGGAGRSLKQDSRNVDHLLRGKPACKCGANGCRRIHLALAKAHRAGHRISLYFLCNVRPDQDIDELERRYIRLKGSAGSEAWQLNG